MNAADVLVQRRRAKLRQLEVSRKVGIDQATLVDIEREKVCVTPETLLRISKAIDEIAEENKNREEVKA